jgi:hypothetical protein
MPFEPSLDPGGRLVPLPLRPLQRHNACMAHYLPRFRPLSSR